jgi:hypothetical protein
MAQQLRINRRYSMSRLATWVWFVVGSIIYWGIAHGFSIEGLETAASAIYFGGATLLLNWIQNKVKS